MCEIAVFHVAKAADETNRYGKWLTFADVEPMSLLTYFVGSGNKINIFESKDKIRGLQNLDVLTLVDA